MTKLYQELQSELFVWQKKKWLIVITQRIA